MGTKDLCSDQTSTYFKGYLRSKKITFQNVSFEAQAKNFFIP